MTPELEKDLGIENSSPEVKKHVERLYNDVVKLARQHEELMRFVKFSLLNDAELLEIRNKLAADGLEWTPNEAKMVQRVIKIVLKHM